MRTGGIAIVCALLALVAGIYLGGHPERLPGPVRDALVDEDRALRAEIVETIEDNFYKPVDESKLDDASLKGIVDSLEDPYSAYISPSEASKFQESISGEFEGVGMSVEKDERGLRVLEVFDDTPAQRAGDREGRRDPLGRRPLDRGPQQRGGHGAHQGPGRHQRQARGLHAGRGRHPHREGRAGEDRGPGGSRPDRRARGAQASA